MAALLVACGIIGAVVGSFLNVVAYRVPAGESIVSPPSACPQCGHSIRPYDNIPVVSWFVLRGRCRDCGASISFRYPLVEAVTAALFVSTAAVIGLEWVLGAYLWFVALAWVLVLTDLDHHRIPNAILYPGGSVATALLIAGGFADGEAGAVGRAVLGGAAYFGLLLVIALVARGGFGFGDVKLAFVLGQFTAYQSWSVWSAGIFLAFLGGGVVAIGLLLTRRRGRKDKIPFGPALVAGAFAAIAIGDRLVDWYLG